LFGGGGIRHWGGRDIGVDGKDRIIACHHIQSLGHNVGGGLHQRAMERSADRQQDSAFSSGGGGFLDCHGHGFLVAADHDLAGGIVIGGNDLKFICGSFLTDRRNLSHIEA